MRDVFDLAKTLRLDPHAPYHRAYPHLVEFFNGAHQIQPSTVVHAAHMVYGWMPTILEMHWGADDRHLHQVADILTKARNGADASPSDLTLLTGVVNRSLVGASKLLHLAAPDRYPIWDSRVYRFVHEAVPYHHRLNDVGTFDSYINLVRSLAKDPRAQQLVADVNAMLGYKVTQVRAVELVMFEHGAKSIDPR